MRESSEFETQKLIFSLIEKEPGLHLNKIAQVLNIERTLVIYHIHYLEKHNLVSIEKKEGYSRCYPRGAVGTEDKKRLSILRQEIPLKIVLFLLAHPYSKHKEILESLDIAKSTLSYHLDKLIKQGIISIQATDNRQGYCVPDKEDIAQFLIKYKPSRIVLGVKDTWADLSIYSKQKSSKNSTNKERI